MLPTDLQNKIFDFEFFDPLSNAVQLDVKCLKVKGTGTNKCYEQFTSASAGAPPGGFRGGLSTFPFKKFLAAPVTASEVF